MPWCSVLRDMFGVHIGKLIFQPMICCVYVSISQQYDMKVK